MVKCRIGEEKNTCLHLMRKYVAYLGQPEPLQIKSVVAPEGAKGYIYVEAFKQTHVKQLIQNVGNLRMGQWTQQVSHAEKPMSPPFANALGYCRWYQSRR
jgi:transcription elongation factor SPT5